MKKQTERDLVIKQIFWSEVEFLHFNKKIAEFSLKVADKDGKNELIHYKKKLEHDKKVISIWCKNFDINISDYLQIREEILNERIEQCNESIKQMQEQDTISIKGLKDAANRLQVLEDEIDIINLAKKSTCIWLQ